MCRATRRHQGTQVTGDVLPAQLGTFSAVAVREFVLSVISQRMPLGDIVETEEGGCSAAVGRGSSGCLVLDYKIAAAGAGEGTTCPAEKAAEAAARDCSLTAQRGRNTTFTPVAVDGTATDNAFGGAAAKMRKQHPSVGTVPPADLVPVPEADAGGGGRGSKQSPAHTSAVAGSGAAERTAGAADGADDACLKTSVAPRTPAAAATVDPDRGVPAAAEECAASDGGSAAATAKIFAAVSEDDASPEAEDELVCTLNGDVPAWQREAQQQPLVGPKESLTALLRDFKGSELQYAKARTFLVRLRRQQQQQSCDCGACSAAQPSTAKEGCCKIESGGSSSSTGGHDSSTAHSDSTESVIHRSRCADCSHKLSSDCSGGPGTSNQSSGDSSREGKQQVEESSRDMSASVAAGNEKEREVPEEDEEDEVLQEIEGGPCMRRVRRDGCCFYRGYMFGLLLYFSRHRDKIKDFIRKINEEFRPEIRKVGYDMDTVADFSQEMIDSLEQVEAAAAKDPASEDIVEEIFNEVSSSNYIVVFARLLVSTHMKLNSELYLPFLTSYATVEEFCKHEVDPMWVAAEQLQINALTAMTQVPVEIIYFDRSPGVNPTHHVFPESQKPQIHLLYRPGHYDILST